MKSFLAVAIRAFGLDPVWRFLFGLGVVLGFIGPFGTFEAMPVWLRLCYWIPLVMSSNVFVGWSHKIVDRLLPQAGLLVCQIAQIFAFTVTFSPFVWAYSGLFDSTILEPANLGLMALYVSGVAGSVGMLVYYMTRETADDTDDDPAPRLASRLPDDGRGPIVRLTVDDHYVEVYLKDGSHHRLLMRLSDAVAEMDNVPGFYTHRSHWVAIGSIVDSLREKNREYLLMETGEKVPVSKTYREMVQSAGFL